MILSSTGYSALFVVHYLMQNDPKLKAAMTEENAIWELLKRLATAKGEASLGAPPPFN